MIEDNGRGFVPTEAADEPDGVGLGMVSMRERASLAGGRFELESSPGAGTSVLVRVPTREAHSP